MKRLPLIIAAAAIVAAIAALIVPMWAMTAHLALDPFAIKMIVLMVIGCFAVGGGLMFLIFYSARKGYDDRIHQIAPKEWKDGSSQRPP